MALRPSGAISARIPWDDRDWWAYQHRRGEDGEMQGHRCAQDFMEVHKTSVLASRAGVNGRRIARLNRARPEMRTRCIRWAQRRKPY